METKLITLKLMVEKSRNRVVFAESNSHFIELLLSFLTLPIGSILHLTDKQPMGSMHKLFECVENLDSDCLLSEACRAMLLRLFNPVAKQSIFAAFSLCYGYICHQPLCIYAPLSFYANVLCSCGSVMDRRVQLGSRTVPKNDKAYVFIISDDLVISQSSTEKAIEILAEFGIEEWSALESIQVDVTAEIIIELLKRLLISDTPLTDVFLGGQNENKIRSIKKSVCQNWNETVQPIASKSIPVKLLLDQDDNKLLFAEADKEFADLLLSFLTYPMSFVVNKLGGQSGIQCIDNLYKCIDSLGSANYWDNNELIEILLRPKLPPYSRLENKLIKLDELYVTDKYYMCRTKLCDSDVVSTIPNIRCKGCMASTNKRLNLIDPKYNSSYRSSKGGFMTSSMFMVTDNLTIEKLSSIMVATDFLKECGRKIKARNIEVGEDEALALLWACITTENALTDALVGSKS